MPARNIRYYGQAQPLPERIPIRAGPLSLVYEAGDLRYIRLGEIEIIRRIYCAVRDRNWNTILPVLSNEQIRIEKDAFEISYEVANRQNDIDFVWQGAIRGEADGTITFIMQGEARSTFLRNRIGFCILHPMACAGVQARIEHTDGDIEEALFPWFIAPQRIEDGRPCPVAPFENLRAVAHAVTPDLWAHVRFEGDVFEMEDQRNWTDASFKTYCTPLSRPFPVEIKSGTVIEQSVTLSLNGLLPAPPQSTEDGPVTLSVGDKLGSLPRIGLGVAGHERPLSASEIKRLRALDLSHLRLDLDLAEPAYRERLTRAAEEAGSLGATLEIGLFLSDDAGAELAQLARAIADIRPPLFQWLIFHAQEQPTPARWIELARQHLSGYDASVRFGSGTHIYFTDLNAKRPSAAGLDVAAYSLNPQVHAFDNGSLVETLAAQAETVVSARKIMGSVPIAVGPITLKPRFNPNATGPETGAGPGALPPEVDERQSSLFGLGWTIGSLKYLAQSGAFSVVYYETTGWRGVMELEGGRSAKDLFWSIPGGVFPLYHLFADMAEMVGGNVVQTQSSHPLRVDSLLVEKDGRGMLLLANFTAEVQPVEMETLPPVIKLRRINETNVVEAMASPETFRKQTLQTIDTSEGSLSLDLMPFESLRIDI